MATPPVIPVVPQIYDVGAEARALVSGYEAGTRKAALAADVWKARMDQQLAEERANLQMAAQLQQLELKEAAMEIQASQKEADLALRAMQFQDKLAFEAEKAQLTALQKGLDRASREDIASMNITSREGIVGKQLASAEDIARQRITSREGISDADRLARIQIAGEQMQNRRDLQAEWIAFQKGRPGEKVKQLQGMAMQAYADEIDKVQNDPQAMAALQSKWGPLMGVGTGAVTPDALAKLNEYAELYRSTAASPELEKAVGSSLTRYQQLRQEKLDAQMDHNSAMNALKALEEAQGVSIIDKQKAYAKAMEAAEKLKNYRALFGDTNAVPVPRHPGPALRLQPGMFPPSNQPNAVTNTPWSRPVNLDLSAVFSTNQPNAVTTLYLGNTNATVDRKKFGDWIEVRQ